MDGIINSNSNLDEMINGVPSTIDVLLPATTTTTVVAPIITTTSTNDRMLDDWSLHVIVNGIPPSVPCLGTTLTNTTSVAPYIPTNNNQKLNDWGLDAIVNGFILTQNARMSSSVVSTTITTPTTPIFIDTDTPVMLIDNHQALENTIYWDQHGMPNNWLRSNIFPSSSSSSVATTTPIAPTINNQNWAQHTSFSSSICGSSISSSFLDATPSTHIHHQGSSSSKGYDHPMSVNNIKQMTQNPNNPLNSSKTQLSSQNWPVLSLPFIGKLTDKPTQKPQQNQLHSSQEISPASINSQTPSNSNDERKNEKRIYKMPVEALNNDVWSWRKYGEKIVDTSPYPRVYYKCNSSKDCKAKRRVEKSVSDPNMLILKYTGCHNHPMPALMNSSSSISITERASSGIATKNDNNHPGSSKVISFTTDMNSETIKDEYIFEGLGNLYDLEKSD